MNEFLKSLQAFGMEGMGTEVEIEAYASSECAEELIELDNLDQACVAMESMSDAIMEGGLEMQTLALESAGFTLDTASGFSGELSNEAVGNMVKRGYYEVKIQIKKVLQKIWKLIISAIESVMGAEGRLKSYGKLFKKYSDRLSKINPKDAKDGTEREVTIRKWEDLNVPGTIETLKTIGGNNGWIRTITSGLKAINIAAGVSAIVNGVIGMNSELANSGANAITSEATDAERSERMERIRQMQTATAEEAERYEKEFEEFMSNMKGEGKDYIKDLVERMKDVDTDDVPILTAKSNLTSLGRTLQAACNRDLKFKKQLIALKKAWDKKTGEWELKGDDTEEQKRVTAAVLRILNKCTPIITAYRMGVSAYYKAVVSNLQGILADMAKVIAKGTNIGA